MEKVTIEVLRNGPLFVTGPIELLDAEERPIVVPEGVRSIKLCRCGRSAEKPFCDGAHRVTGWNESGSP
jgi:CDGSH-type Zn-finger protein